MHGENNSNFERYEMESDFRHFAQYNQYMFEESVRPMQDQVLDKELKKAQKAQKLLAPEEQKDLYRAPTLGEVISQSVI